MFKGLHCLGYNHSFHSVFNLSLLSSQIELVKKISWIHGKSKNLSNLCMTVTCFFVLRVETDFNFLCVGLNFELGTGNSSNLEWPPKPSYVSSGLASTEELSFVWWAFLNMLNLLLPEDNFRFMLWEPFRGVRPKLHDLIFRYGDSGSDVSCALDPGDSSVPNCKEDSKIFHMIITLSPVAYTNLI